MARHERTVTFRKARVKTREVKIQKTIKGPILEWYRIIDSSKTERTLSTLRKRSKWNPLCGTISRGATHALITKKKAGAK